eukprot:TRINITY_DN2536_c0_g2_i1.p1 TRINITY_DN2536_c0_g2~~TRINITY_DN2536_c0_g2_i1.p1  ORF type:complete len:129 (-),score=8.07 TRINITY_DN2536_c0_g2_i1:92-478(-)
MSPNLSTLFLRFPSPTIFPAKFTNLSNSKLKPTRPWHPEMYLNKPINRINCISIPRPPKKRSASKGERSDGGDLVWILLRNFDGDDKPLVSTLNKYVRMIRTEHCFLLFEELGKREKWLQCLEICRRI